MSRRMQIAVIGSDDVGLDELEAARAVGAGLAAAGAVLMCGGLGGVMEAACAGAHEAGGLTVGILPGSDPSDANPHVDVVVATGAGEGRNVAVASSADAVVAIGGGFGTLSEIALARRAGVTVVGLRTWELAHAGVDVPTVVAVDAPGAAVEAAVQAAAQVVRGSP